MEDFITLRWEWKDENLRKARENLSWLKYMEEILTIETLNFS